MAQFTVTLNAKINQPPDAIGVNTINIVDPNATYILTIEDLTTDTSPPYNDPEGDVPFNLRILTITAAGVLYIDGAPAINNDVISFLDIEANKLTFIPDANMSPYEEPFTFDIADSGSGQYSGLGVGQILLNIGGAINQPPIVGDGEETIDYASNLVFTRVMFTTQTTPAYSDPEGDAAADLKVLSLPVDGVLQLNGTDVIINQVISFVDIDAGNFIYVSGLDDTNGDIESFNFAIADAGSGIFVS